MIRTIVFIIFWFASLVGCAQTTDLLYIFPSKEVYETGEDMWFKAYLMDRQTFALSDRSQTLYLQLRSEKGDVVWSEKYLLTAGRGDGHVYIGDKWQQGEYLMEGYARSSFTTDSTLAIHPRRIRVVDRVSQMDSISSEAVKQDSIEKITAKHRFDLFPEGGNLIDGIDAVVAFKATYGNGMPEDVTGKVLENGQEIAAINSMHDGMGAFTLTPHRDKEYQVLLSDGRTYPLPDIQLSGMALRVLRTSKTAITVLISSPDSIARPFTLTTKMRGMTCSKAQGTLRGKQTVKLPIKEFNMQGVAEITLADGDGRPVAERLVYVNPEQRLNVKAKTNQQRYDRREKGKASFQITDPSGKPIKAELAVSIFDKAYLYQPGHENILSHCFLAEEIRGNIFNPTYYFDERNDDRLLALDLLLMTQGWRRYVWDQQPVQGRTILSDGIAGRDRAPKLQFIQAFKPSSDTCLVMSDSLGRFEIEPLLLDHLRGDFYIKALRKKPKPKLLLENPFDSIDFYQQGRQRFLPMSHLVETEYGERDVIDGFGTVVLDNVLVTAKKQSPYRDKVIEDLDSVILMDTGAWVCEHGFINDYHGYSHHPSYYPYPYFGKRLKPKRGELYGRCLLEWHGDRWWNMVCKMGPVLYEGPYVTDKTLLEMNNMMLTRGYYPKREFYEPDPIDLTPTMPDPRNTLQWKPNVLTDENGKAEISFTASDVNTEFIGIVEAIDGNGLMGCQTFTFRVIRNK